MSQVLPGTPLSKLCPHCLAENHVAAHLCQSCHTPMTFFAATDPLLRIWSEMDTFAKAARAPRNWIVLVGMWLLFGPPVLLYGLVMLQSSADVITVSPMIFPTTLTGTGLLAALFILVFALILVKTTHNFFRPPAPDMAEDEQLTREAQEAAPNGDEPGDVLQE